MRLELDDNFFVLENCNSKFGTLEKPPIPYEVSDIKNTLDNLLDVFLTLSKTKSNGDFSS